MWFFIIGYLGAFVEVSSEFDGGGGAGGNNPVCAGQRYDLE